MNQARAPSRYIVGPFYDGFFFLFSPLVGLATGAAIGGTPFGTSTELHPGALPVRSALPMAVATTVLIHAHLVIVFFRSHGNAEIFRTHRWRFTVAPAALFVAAMASEWVLVFVAWLATWWDVYHSSLQTFGLGRIYDAKAGADPRVGRRLDMVLNHFLYIGPILAGAALLPHLGSFSEFSRVNAVYLTSVPAHVGSFSRPMTLIVSAGGAVFFLYYIYRYRSLARDGYRVSRNKVLLLVATGVTSIYAWGFNSFGEAFFIMNYFHAVQYFALVWHAERTNLLRRFHLSGSREGSAIAALVFVGAGLLYGYTAQSLTSDPSAPLLYRVALAASLVVSIMHFWYDGFIWSVRAKQV